MLNKSIAYRLSIYISLSVIGVFIAFIAIYFVFNQSLIEEHVENTAIGLSTQVVSDVKMHITATTEITNNISEQIMFYGEHAHADEFISSLVEKYSFINALHINIDSTIPKVNYHNYYCFKNGDTARVFKKNQRFKTCVTEEPQFRKLIENGSRGWSEPLFCKRNNKVVVSYYTPIILNDNEHVDKQIGEVICELSLSQLNESINAIKIGEGRSYAFLITKAGNYITHPNKDLILKRNVHDLPEKSLRKNRINLHEVLSKKLTGAVIAYPDYLDYEKCWVYYTPVKDSDWMLVFVQPHREMYEPLYLPVLQMLFFSVLGILVIYLLVTYIANKQIQPLSLLTQQLKKFSSLTGDISEMSQNEIRQVSESLNFMKSWYEKYKITQTEEDQKTKVRKRDIRQASEIQNSFIKTTFPAFPDRNDIDLHAIYKPARGVSGDLFDYFFIDDDHLLCTMGDVSGKGIPAAFFMSVAQTIIKNNARGTSAKQIVETANNELYTNNQHQFFLTLFLGILNVKTGTLIYCNAAHTPPYILKANGELVNLAQSHGLPLGLYCDKHYKEATIQVDSGDSLVLYTDGVTDQNDSSRLQYGTNKLEKNLKNLAGLSPKEMVFRIEKSLSLFVGDSQQSDDISLLVLKYKA